MKKEKRLTECEEKVMEIILDATEELNLPEIVARVNEKYKKDWKPQTVSTFLQRIVKKGMAEPRRAGRTFLYRPTITKQEYLKKITIDFCEMWYDGDAEKMYEVAKSNKK